MNAPPTQPGTATFATQAESTATAREGLMAIFPFLYKILAGISLLLFGIALLLSLTDLFAFSLAETIQKIKTTQPNYSFVIEDTNEYKLLDYSSKYLTSEPYLIYTQNNVLNMSMTVVGFALIVFAFQLGIFVVLKIRAAIYQESYGDSLDLGSMTNSFMVLGVLFLGGVVLSAIYKSFFQKAYQSAASNMMKDLQEIDRNIRNGLTKNAAFIGALKNHNMPMVYRILKEYAANAKTTNNFTDLQNLLFTMSIFNYFDSITPEGSDARKHVMSLFGTDDASKQVRPHALFFYQGTNSITNVFDAIAKDSKGAYVPEFASLQPSKMLDLSSSLDARIQALNDALLKLKSPSKLKIKFVMYLVMCLVAAAGVLALLWFGPQFAAMFRAKIHQAEKN